MSATIQTASWNNLSNYRTHLMKLYIEAFTTGSYLHNQGKIHENTCWTHWKSIMEHEGHSIVALEENEKFPIGILLGCSLAFDDVFKSTSLAKKIDIDGYRYIAELAVDARFRGQKIGHDLVFKFLSTIDWNTSKGVLVRTNEHDERLHRFYKSTGFEKLDVIGRQSNGIEKRYFFHSGP